MIIIDLSSICRRKITLFFQVSLLHTKLNIRKDCKIEERNILQDDLNINHLSFYCCLNKREQHMQKVSIKMLFAVGSQDTNLFIYRKQESQASVTMEAQLNF